MPTFHIPLEDLRDGWQMSGAWGQQIFGAGAPFVFAADLTTGVPEERITREPAGFMLQNHPNPFNAGTVISYRVPDAARLDPGKVHLNIYDVTGRKVMALPVEQNPGVQEVHWDGCNAQGQPVSAGLYFVVLDMTGRRLVRKILLMR